MSKKGQPAPKPLAPPAPPAPANARSAGRSARKVSTGRKAVRTTTAPPARPKRSLKAPPKPQRPQRLTYEQARRQVLERIVNEQDERFWLLYKDLVQEEMVAFGGFYESEEEAMLKVAEGIVRSEVSKLLY